MRTLKVAPRWVHSTHSNPKFSGSRRATARASLLTPSDKGRQREYIPPGRWLQHQTLVTGLSASILGPLLDGLHSSHNVLHYHHPVLIKILSFQLETCWWVPILFGLAGIILGVSHPLLDGVIDSSSSYPSSSSSSSARLQNSQIKNPSWFLILFGIALYVLQYYISGVMEEPLLGDKLLGVVPTIDVVLATAGGALWYILDKTPQGFLMASLTAICGPLLEIVLINTLHLYHYSHPDWANAIPSWIVWVYFGGAPAVGNLGRKISYSLITRS